MQKYREKGPRNPQFAARTTGTQEYPGAEEITKEARKGRGGRFGVKECDTLTSGHNEEEVTELHAWHLRDIWRSDRALGSSPIFRGWTEVGESMRELVRIGQHRKTKLSQGAKALKLPDWVVGSRSLRANQCSQACY